MAIKKKVNQPGLFDFDPDMPAVEAVPPEGETVEGERSAWRANPLRDFAGVELDVPLWTRKPLEPWGEVPGAVFLSWSEGRQLSYCALRDRDALKRADSPEEQSFYLGRALAYETELNALRGSLRV